ncbi:MAG: hypothetical protein V1712_02645 [Patescibacteria group bacterium]
MRQDYQKLLSLLDSPQPPKNLFNLIIKRVVLEKQRAGARIRLAIFSVTTVISLAALIMTYQIVSSNLYQSGFIESFSLIFSDWQYLSNYWQNFVMFLLESLPATSFIMLLASLLLFINSVKVLIKNIKLSLISFNHNWGV